MAAKGGKAFFFFFFSSSTTKKVAPFFIFRGPDCADVKKYGSRYFFFSRDIFSREFLTRKINLRRFLGLGRRVLRNCGNGRRIWRWRTDVRVSYGALRRPYYEIRRNLIRHVSALFVIFGPTNVNWETCGKVAHQSAR